MIKRTIENEIKSQLFSGKAIIMIGARQVGKTTLQKSILSKSKNLLWLRC